MIKENKEITLPANKLASEKHLHIYLQYNHKPAKYYSMHIAYSALRTTTKNDKAQLKNQQLQQRLEGYQAICQKYNHEIAAIQKYLPGWMPPFGAKAK